MPGHVEVTVQGDPEMGRRAAPGDLLALQAQRRLSPVVPKADKLCFGDVEREPPLRQPGRQQVEGTLELLRCVRVVSDLTR